MRVMVTILALTLVGGITASALSAADTRPPGNKAKVSADDTIVSCVMMCLDVDKATLQQLEGKGWTDADFAAACTIALKSNASMQDVIAEYDSSKNWSQVARKFNVSATEVIKVREMAENDPDTLNQMFVAQCYGVSESSVAKLRQDNVNWGEICVIANASRRTGQSVEQIASLRADGLSWEQIGAKYNVASSCFTEPVQSRMVAVRPLAGAGPMVAPCVIYDDACNPMLTYDQAMRLYRKGYDWLDVAVAVNISRAASYPIELILAQMRTGRAWRDVIVDFGLSPDVAFNVCDYPFPRISIYSRGVEQSNLRTIQRYQKAKPPRPSCGSPCAPCGEPCPQPCPDPSKPCPEPCGPTCPTTAIPTNSSLSA